jgi:hypothetical protein
MTVWQLKNVAFRRIPFIILNYTVKMISRRAYRGSAWRVMIFLKSRAQRPGEPIFQLHPE